jgi:HEAT repeat protein
MRTASRIVLGILLMLGTIELSAADELKSVVNALKSADAQTRIMAIQRLGESGDIRAVQPLLAALNDENALVRTYAIEALQRLVSILDDVHGIVKRWLQTLIKSLKNEPAGEVITVARPVASTHLDQVER